MWHLLSECLSIHLSLCHTCESRLNGSRYRNTFYTLRYSNLSSLLMPNIHGVASDNVYYWHNDYYCLNAAVWVTYLFQVTDFLHHVCDLCMCVPVTVSVIASFRSPLLSHMAVHHLHHLHYHRLHLLLLAQYFILNSRPGSSANPFLHRPFPFPSDWLHGLSYHLTILLCSAAVLVSVLD